MKIYPKDSYKDICDEITNDQANRGDIVLAMRDYNKLVHSRGRLIRGSQNTSVFAVEETVQPFVEDAVKSTFGMCWTSSEQPFRLICNNPDLRDDPDVINFYEESGRILIEELNKVESGFTRALEQCLKNYFEYGCTFLQLMEDEENKSFYCKAFNLEISYPVFSKLDRLEKILVGCGDDQILFEKLEKHRWTIRTLHKYFETESLETNFVPVYYLSQTPDNEMRFPIGQGLSALPEIKKMDCIVSDFSEAAAKLLKPVEYYFSQLCASNQDALTTIFSNSGTPVAIETSSIDRGVPFGWARIPADVAPALEMLNRLIVKLREKFGFINRLFSVKANEQMTATEATIRTRADRNQTKHLQDMITGQLLNPLFHSCLRIMNGYNKLPKRPDILDDIFDITIEHSSIYQETEDEKRLAQINGGLTLWSNILQFSAMAKQIGAPTPDLTSLTNEINRIVRLPAQQSSASNVTANVLDEILAGNVMDEEAAIPEEAVPVQ